MKILNSTFPPVILFFIFLLNWNFIAVAPVSQSNEAPNMLCDCQMLTSQDIILQLGDTYQAETIFSCQESQIESFSWSPADYLSCTDCFDPVVQPLQDICYTLTATFTDGCTTTDEFCVSVRPCESVPGDNAINGISASPIGDEATIELEIARTQFVHLEIVEDDVVQYVIWEGFLSAGLRTVTLDFSAVPSGDHELRARLYPEDKFIDIVKL
ncbi:MAG: hypothetical protein ACI8P3_002780 [Saprospiraceae bacterium]|jgi:hypothetical protein